MASTSTPTASSLLSDLDTSPYERVEVLMLRWGSNHEIVKSYEMGLQIAFQEYGYGVAVFDVEGFGQPSHSLRRGSRVKDVVMKWAGKFDVGPREQKKTLLIITYTGHGGMRPGGRLFAGDGRDNVEEEFDLSWLQMDCRRKIKNSDLYWINNCCHAAHQGYVSRYTQGCPLMQMEVLAAAQGVCHIVDCETNFTGRITSNLKQQTEALTVHQRYCAVHKPGDISGAGFHQVRAGTSERSIVIAPLRQPNGSIIVHQYWMVEDMVDIDGHKFRPEEGSWRQWNNRPATPPAGVDLWREKHPEEIR